MAVASESEWMSHHSSIFSMKLFLHVYLNPKPLTLGGYRARAWIPAAAGRRGAGLSVAAHSNKHLSISGGGVSMADAPGGEER